MSNKAELILIADDEKLLEIAKGSKIKFDKQLALDIAEIVSKIFSYNPFAATINTALAVFNRKERGT